MRELDRFLLRRLTLHLLVIAGATLSLLLLIEGIEGAARSQQGSLEVLIQSLWRIPLTLRELLPVLAGISGGALIGSLRTQGSLLTLSGGGHGFRALHLRVSLMGAVLGGGALLALELSAPWLMEREREAEVLERGHRWDLIEGWVQLEAGLLRVERSLEAGELLVGGLLLQSEPPVRFEAERWRWEDGDWRVEGAGGCWLLEEGPPRWEQDCAPALPSPHLLTLALHWPPEEAGLTELRQHPEEEGWFWWRLLTLIGPGLLLSSASALAWTRRWGRALSSTSAALVGSLWMLSSWALIGSGPGVALPSLVLLTLSWWLRRAPPRP